MPFLYFAGVGVVLAVIWLAQAGQNGADAANTGHSDAQLAQSGGGGGSQQPRQPNTPYSLGEQPGQDPASPYGGTIDATSVTGGLTSSGTKTQAQTGYFTGPTYPTSSSPVPAPIIPVGPGATVPAPIIQAPVGTPLFGLGQGSGGTQFQKAS